MTTTFHIKSEELNEDFLQRIKGAFGNKQLLITIEEDTDDTFFLLSTKENRDKLKQSITELHDGDTIEVTLEDLRK